MTFETGFWDLVTSDWYVFQSSFSEYDLWNAYIVVGNDANIGDFQSSFSEYDL